MICILVCYQVHICSFFLFDSITLLSSGQTVYTGPVTEALTYFDQNGFPCPQHVNPADHLIDIITVDTRTPQAEEQSSDRVNSLILSWQRIQLPSLNGTEKDTTLSPPIKPIKVSLIREIWYLTSRNFWITIRDPFGLGGFLLASIISGTLVGWIFYKIPQTLTGVRTMQGFIYTVLSLQGYLLLVFTIYKVSIDMQVPQSESL